MTLYMYSLLIRPVLFHRKDVQRGYVATAIWQKGTHAYGNVGIPGTYIYVKIILLELGTDSNTEVVPAPQGGRLW
jgi:hypothetical protein